MKHLSMNELKSMTMKEIIAWIDDNACEINKTCEMSCGHEELFKGFHIRPEYIGFKAGRLIVKTFHITSRTRKADAVEFVIWLHWAISGEYPKEEIKETEQTSEEAQETSTNDTKSEEENTMKNTKKHMTKIEAIKALANMGSGMYARIFGSDKYSVIDDGINSMIITAASMDEEAFTECENWMDVLVVVNAHHEKQNYYIIGNADFRAYHIKYGYDKAVTILQNYIETITQEGIADTKTEQDYIRGAKDALCIA